MLSGKLLLSHTGYVDSGDCRDRRIQSVYQEEYRNYVHTKGYYRWRVSVLEHTDRIEEEPEDTAGNVD